MGAVSDTQGDCCGCSFQAFLFSQVENMSDKRLSRGADDNRAGQRV
jgi:hypothetical protein